MRNRATEKMHDDDKDGRNENWYARKVYGDQYEKIRKVYQDYKMEELNE